MKIDSQNEARGHGQTGLNEVAARRWISAIIILAIGWKVLLLGLDLFPFNSDEAIVGLMARHILQGQVPTFFYGQAYLGSLDAILVASLMALFGSHVWVIRLTQIILYALTVFGVFKLTRQIMGTASSGLVSAIIMAVPTVNMTLYTTVSLGGYAEALLIGVLLLLTLNRIEDEGPKIKWVLIWGFIAGLGFWAFGLTLVFSLPGLVGLGLILRRRRVQSMWKHVAAAIIGWLIGSSPWWVWALTRGPQLLIRELFGAAIAGASSGSLIVSWLQHSRNFLLFGPTVILGLRPPWGTQPLLPFVMLIPILFWILVFAFVWKRIGGITMKVTERVFLASGGLVILGFIFTNFGADPSGRYFIPLMLPLAVYAGGAFDWLKKTGGRRLSLAFLLALCLYNAGSTLQAAFRDQTGLTTQFDPVARIDFSKVEELIDFLELKNIDRGYTNYWVAYPLAFLTNEQIIFSPRLPYHQDFRYTDRDDRYPPYTDKVAASDRVAYITTNHPDLNAALQRSLNEQRIDYEVSKINSFTIIHDLSQSIRPDQLQLPTSKEADQ